MKHFWTHATINKGRSPRQAYEWITAKQAELLTRTGVPWSASPTGDGVNFLPYMTKKLAEERADSDVAYRIDEWLEAQPRSMEPYVTLLTISEALNIPLPEVCGTCWALANSKIVPATLKVTVDRMGKPTAVALVGR